MDNQLMHEGFAALGQGCNVEVVGGLWVHGDLIVLGDLEVVDGDINLFHPDSIAEETNIPM